MIFIIPWIGGKYFYAKWIINHFPSDYKDLAYIEPFGGAAWVLYKKERSRLEVYNDINSDLVNLFTVLRDKYEQFEKRAYWVLHSREMWRNSYEKIYKTRDFEDDVDRALHFAIVITQSFSGCGRSWSHGVSNKTCKRSTWFSFLDRIKNIRERLKYVQIENLDYREILKKYNHENSLFYIDPPYIINKKTNDYYITAWDEKEHIKLSKYIKKLKGYWILSGYNSELYESLYSEFSWYYKEGCKFSKKTQGRRNKCTECLITNIPEYIMLKNNRWE